MTGRGLLKKRTIDLLPAHIRQGEDQLRQSINWNEKPTYGAYEAAPFDDPLTHIGKISSDLENAAGAIYDDPSRLPRGLGKAAMALGESGAAALTFPARAMKGEVDLQSDQAIGEAFNAAGWLMGGGLGRVAAKPAGAELGMFGGRLAKTADLDALAKAEAGDAAGVPREAIWDDHGWFKGVDGKWRFEIDDSAAKRRAIPLAKRLVLGSEEQSLAEAFAHPRAYEAYPDTADIDFMTQKEPGATYFPRVDDLDSEYSVPEGITIGRVNDPLSVMLHELQHAVQNREGFNFGGAPEGFSGADVDRVRKSITSRYNDLVKRGAMREDPAELEKALNDKSIKLHLYKTLAGEVEARAAQKRKDLTAAERRARYPWLDYDVPEADQIVKFGATEQSRHAPDDRLAAGHPLLPWLPRDDRNP